MRKTIGALGIGFLSLGVLACTSSSTPVSPSATTGAAAGSIGGEFSAEVKPDHADAAKPGSLTIVDIVLQDDGEFDVLQAAVIKAGLVDALNGSRQVTVFAPTDMAFVTTLAVGSEAEAISAVNALDPAALRDILLYHVTSGRRNSNSVLAAPSYQMLNGDTLTRSALTNAGIAATDISASNGIVHVINAVLLP